MAASRQGSRLRGITAANNSTISPASSTTSSSVRQLEPSFDGMSSPASSSAQSKPPYFNTESASVSVERSKENITVTVRFRPLSPREIRHGEEIAWYADGDNIVRNEHNTSTAYAYDRVFGPITTTRHVYDVAAQHVVSGAMDGINGTIFAYGVTSSGKTHTMHGDQRSPGIIPLAVKDAFSIIQETPTREFLLRVSYLEIYNEVINDLLNPAGQNLRIREDSQGTYVEGVKEEVVLSPAHALSLIAAGEEHRHVGSTNFNLQSSRSHTIFTLTIESSPCGENCEGQAVTLSQLNLIDLAGSESSRVETTGLRRKEGSYINKSLLTLGTVISKLTDGKSAHVPYRDSKLTRLLQSSLSGNGRVSLICTVTPSSSNSEETHNTLKFAHRAKHIEIQAAKNKIVDEKSLIKKYQNEIRCLKEELEHLKRGIISVPQLTDNADGDILLLKQKLEDGQVRLQSRLEQEEEAKAALMGRIQRLTKLILVSTKATQPSRFPQRSVQLRRHSFGEEELAYLPHRRRDLFFGDDNTDILVPLDGNVDTADDKSRDEKKSKKNGLMSWLKLRKKETGNGIVANSSEKSNGIKSESSPSTPPGVSSNVDSDARISPSGIIENDVSIGMKHNEDAFEDDDCFLEQGTSLADMKNMDEIDLLREQQKILSGDMALHISTLKRLSEEAGKNPKENTQMEINNLKEEILQKKNQIALIGKQINDSIRPHREDGLEESHVVAELTAQLNEKSLELEVKAADNRVIQDQLNNKTLECEELQRTVDSLKQQLSDALEKRNSNPLGSHVSPVPVNSNDMLLLRTQEVEIQELRQQVAGFMELKEELESRNKKLAEESSYAKGLASAAAVELKALSEEVAKLMNHNNRLSAELEAQKKSPAQRRTTPPTRNLRKDGYARKQQEQAVMNSDVKRELLLSRERELSFEAALAEREQIEAELHKKIEESKQKEAYLENELANMWILVAKLKKCPGAEDDASLQKTDDL